MLSTSVGADPAEYSKRITFQHTFPLPRRPHAETKQTKRTRKKHRSPKSKDHEKKPSTTKAKNPDAAKETRRDYERSRNKSPERMAYQRLYQQKKQQEAIALGLCKHCRRPAILGQTRCESCAEKHRLSRRRTDAKRRPQPKRQGQPRNVAGNLYSPQAVIFSTSFVDVLLVL